MSATKSRPILIILVLCISAVVAFTLFNRKSPSFDSLDEFSTAWNATPVKDRHRIVGWLLGTTPRRHTTYPLENCKLRGLTKEEVVAILGPTTVWEGGNVSIPAKEISYEIPYEVYYPLGSIEYAPLHLKQDDLHIEFDENGVVRKVDITS